MRGGGAPKIRDRKRNIPVALQSEQGRKDSNKRRKTRENPVWKVIYSVRVGQGRIGVRGTIESGRIMERKDGSFEKCQDSRGVSREATNTPKKSPNL